MNPVSNQNRLRQQKKEIQQEQDEARQALQGLDTEADPELAAKLLQNSEQCLQKERISSTGYLYFKVWIMPDSSKWYKIGITNDLRRRDAEQMYCRSRQQRSNP